jgi:hypothetical protein
MAGTGDMASEASAQLVQDAQTIVRDLYYKRLSGTLRPIDDATRRILETCLQRGLRCGDASPEERAFAARLGI